MTNDGSTNDHESNKTLKQSFTPYPFPQVRLDAGTSDFDSGGRFADIDKAHNIPDLNVDDIDKLQYWLDNRHRPLRRVTLGELASQLPVGKWVAGAADRSLAVASSMNGAQRRKLAKIQSDEKKLSFDKLLRDVLGMSCHNILGHDLTQMHSGQIAATIGPMAMSDVVYAYVYLRRLVYGPTVGLNLTCSQCTSSYHSYLNLDKLEVDVVDDPSQLTWEYVLQKPIKWRGKLLEKVVMQNTPFASMARQDRRFAQHPDYIISYTLASSICGVNDRPVAVMSISVEDLDDWDVNDIDGASHMIGKHAAGPELSAMTTCTECGAEQLSMIDSNPLTFFRRAAPEREHR